MLTILAWNNHSYKHTIPLLHPCMFTFSETIKSYTYDLRIRVMLMLPSLYWAFSKGIKSVYDVRAWCIHIGKTEWIKFLQFKDGIKKSDVQLLCIIMRSFLFWFEHLFICFSLFLFSHKIIFNFWRICEFDWIANRENYIEDLNQSFVTAHQIHAQQRRRQQQQQRRQQSKNIASKPFSARSTKTQNKASYIIIHIRSLSPRRILAKKSRDK